MAFDFQSFNKTFIILINLIGVWVIFWVYFADRKKVLNRGFALFVTPVLLWIDFYNLAFLISDRNVSLLLIRLTFASAFIFFIGSYYFFIIWFLEEKSRYIFLGKLIIIFESTLAFISIFTDLIIKDIYIVKLGIVPVFSNFGSLSFFFITSILTLFISGDLVIKYSKLEKKIQQKIQYFLIGVFIFIIGVFLFGVILPFFFGIYNYYQIANYFTIFLLVFTAYAIVKQKLFGIKIVLTGLLVSFIALLLAFDIFVFTESHILQFFKGIALVVFLYLGRELIRSVLKEEERMAEIEKMARGLALANQNLRDLLSMKNDFLHIVSHQLRTPLTAMRGFISMWNEGDFDNFSAPKMAEIKKKMLNNAERLNNMVNDMVMAMESEGEFKICLQQVDLRKILTNDIEMMKPSFEKKNLYLKYREITKDIPMIEADEKLLMNVFMNLIDNAEKYTEKGGLTITFGQDGNNVKISFIDTGVGLSKDDKRILFKKFSRGKKSNYINPNGTGLGLFIIKQIIARHYGRIKATSKGEGKGATFTITLPVRQGR